MARRWVLALVVPALLALALPPALHAQGGREWVRPYRQAPNYWELVGRLFGDSSAIADDPRLKAVAGPAVLTVAEIKSRAKPGETFASFAALTLNTDSDNIADAQEPRFVVRDVTQVRAILTGTQGIAVEARTGNSTFPHQQCIDGQMLRQAHLLDGRWQAVAACERTVFWSLWQRQTRLPFAGTYVVDGWTTLAISYERKTGEMSVTLQTQVQAPAPAPRRTARGRDTAPRSGQP